MTQGISKKVSRKLVHSIADPRKFYYQKVSDFAGSKKRKKILELGSGPLVKGKYYYSAKHLFAENNDFVRSDIDKSFGHPIVDVTKMNYKEEFDIILCLNVLEHVYEYQKAIKNIHRALKRNGVVIVAVPAFYPLHDEPHDYWRFTEHALRKMFSDFNKVTVMHKGKREFPFGYYLEVMK